MSTRSDRPEPAVRVGAEIEQKWPGADAACTELAINFLVMSNRVIAFSEALCKKHGVPSPAAFNVMTILYGAAEPLPPSVIAARMFVTRPTMTGVLRSLSRRRLVAVAAHPDDGRMSLVALTDGGRATVERMRPELHRAEKRWMMTLDRTEQQALLAILARLQANPPRVE
jgi:DNA-binding MarR family transcriptional regulator